MKNNVYEKMYANLEVIRKKGCDLKAGLSLIKNNPILLEYSPEELDHKLSFIVNHNQIYAALFVNNNYYEWSLYEDGIFSSLQSPTMYDEESEDLVVEMIIDSIIHNKLTKRKNNLSLEDEINNFKNTVKTNNLGYHIK